MSKLRNIFDKINLNKIETSHVGKKILIVDRQRIFSVIKNYSAIKILEKKNLIETHILTDLKENEKVSQFYKSLGFQKIINSFRVEYLLLKPLISIKTFFHFIKYFIFFIKKDLNNFIYFYKVSNINIGDIVYDRYIRNDHSFLNPNKFDLKLIRIFLTTVFKVYWIEKYLEKNKIKLILINTHIYANNYSIAYKLAKKLKIDLLYLKDFQITYFKKGLISKKNDPRVITLDKLKKISLSTKETSLLSKYNEKRFTGKLPHFDVKNAFRSKKKIKEFLNKKKINLKDYSKKILLASHSLSDANHFYFELGSKSPFKDYYSQIIETLKFAEKNKDILFFVRPHPSSKFWKEDGLIKKLLQKYNFENVCLLDNNINTNEAMSVSDTVITVYGTIGLESASYYKKKPILAGNSIYSNLGFTLDSNTKQKYFDHILSDKKNFKLNKSEQLKANKAFYYYFLKFNIEYESVIANRVRNISDKDYFKNLKNFLKTGSLNKDQYYKKLEKKLFKIIL